MTALKREVHIFTEDHMCLKRLPNVLIHTNRDTFTNLTQCIQLMKARQHLCIIIDDMVIDVQSATLLRSIIDVIVPKNNALFIMITHNLTYTHCLNALCGAFDVWLIPLHPSNKVLHTTLVRKLQITDDPWPSLSAGHSSGFWHYDRRGQTVLKLYYNSREQPQRDHSFIRSICPPPLRQKLNFYLHFFPPQILDQHTYLISFRKKRIHLLDFCMINTNPSRSNQLDSWTKAFLNYLADQSIIIPRCINRSFV